MTVYIFQPLLEIHYDDRFPRAFVQTYSLDGKPHSKTPEQMAFADLGTLYFQLLDKGYSLHADPPDDGGMHIIRAMSTEMAAYQRAKLADVVLNSFRVPTDDKLADRAVK